jgi:hypothetical protein
MIYKDTYLVVDLVFLSREAMHELPFGMGTSLTTECFCYLVASKVAHALLILCLLTH